MEVTTMSKSFPITKLFLFLYESNADDRLDDEYSTVNFVPSDLASGKLLRPFEYEIVDRYADIFQTFRVAA
jgi:hypothetical protein